MHRATIFVAVLPLIGVGQQGSNDKPLRERDLAAWVEQRVKDWQPVEKERRVDAIGWARDLPEAQRLAKEHRRPVFLFTYSGAEDRANAIAQQRC